MSDIEHYKGRQFKLEIIPDDDCGPPWENEDGHGPVSDWTTRSKCPGEWLLCTDRYNHKRYYDFAMAMQIAKRDRWDAPPYNTGSSGEQALRAVQADFDYLRSWCSNDWFYVGVIVTLLNEEGEPTDYTESLWGVEYNYESNDCHMEVFRELAEDLIRQVEKDELTEHIQNRFIDAMTNAL